MPDCSDIRKQWDEAFDADRSPARPIAQHLAECAECGAYSEGALALREALHTLPLSATNAAADQAILNALRSERRPAPAVRRPAVPLVFAGAGSFALTLIVAGVMLSAASGTPESSSLSAPSGIVARPSSTLPDASAELDAWLASPGLITGTRAYRPVAAPAAPPKRRNLRGQSGPAFIG
jgi:hypothetical protein